MPFQLTTAAQHFQGHALGLIRVGQRKFAVLTIALKVPEYISPPP
ncbi:hypothetical protein [Leptolyngbya subtilissima]